MTETPKFLIDFNVKYYGCIDPHWRGRENYPEVKFELMDAISTATKSLLGQKPEVLGSLELVKVSFRQADGEEIRLFISAVVVQKEIGAPRDAYAEVILSNDAEKRHSAITNCCEELLSDLNKILREKLRIVEERGNKLRRIIAL